MGRESMLSKSFLGASSARKVTPSRYESTAQKVELSAFLTKKQFYGALIITKTFKSVIHSGISYTVAVQQLLRISKAQLL